MEISPFLEYWIIVVLKLMAVGKVMNILFVVYYHAKDYLDSHILEDMRDTHYPD